jgi:hypothetical protein
MSPNPSTRRRYHPRSTLLTLLIIISLLNISGFHTLTVQAANTAATATAPSTIGSAQAVGQSDPPEPSPPPTVQLDTEVTGRSAFTRTTRNPDGSYTTTFSSRPMHWKDPQTGIWKEFVNTLRPVPANEAQQGFAYENTANGFQARFGKPGDIASGRPVLRFKTPRAAVSMVAVGAAPQDVRVSDAEITYTGAYPGVDVRYTVDNERVKEEFVLHQAPATPALATGCTQELSGYAAARCMKQHGLALSAASTCFFRR